MRITNPKTGKSFVQKRRVRHDEPGQAREWTFCGYRSFQFLSRDRTRNWFVEALEGPENQRVRLSAQPIEANDARGPRT